MNRKIYIDLDETLINSHGVWESNIDINTDFNYWEWQCVDGVGYSMHVERFVTYLRPFALEFVKELQDEYGLDNVFILTAASDDYAIAIIDHFNFDIPRGQILARQHYTGSNPILNKRDPVDNPVLIDNQYHSEPNAKKKIKFLGGSKAVKYHNIEPFYVSLNSTPEHSDHKQVFKQISDAVRDVNRGVIMHVSRHKGKEYL
jgi:hypothetical protein